MSNLSSLASARVSPWAPASRRVAMLAALVVALLVAVALVAAATPASADTGALVLAAEGEPLGPDPMPRGAEDNPARELAGYEDREVPFTWGAAWLLTFLGLSGLAVMGIVYFRAVERPGARDREAGARR
jgi:hypothetical protein